MHELDEIMEFIVTALSANAAKGFGSVLTIKIAPYPKGKKGKKTEPQQIVTNDDVLDAHEILKTFDGDFKKLFGSRKS